MELTIHNVIVHELIKEQHKDLNPSNMRKSVLPNEDANVIKLVTGVLGAYGQKSNSAQYGCFKTKKVSNFPNLYDDYHNLKDTTSECFIEFTNKTMGEIENTILDGKKTSASGGYILFVDVENEHGRSFLIAMLKNKPGLRLSENLSPEELDHIDLSRLHQAARISKQKYDDYCQAEDKAQITYLSFVSPSSNQSTAGYFIEALGCSKGTASATSTKLIIQEVPSFFREDPELDKNNAKKVKADLMQYLNNCSEKGIRARLLEIEAIARKYFPNDKPEQADDLAAKLFYRLNGEKNGIPVEFSVNKSELKKAKYHKLISNNWKLEVNKNSIGTNKDAEIRYHDNCLTINNLSPELRNEIEENLREKGIII
ncbi:nucleoid-associated protein [Photobacterium leiognathi]|uniref:nucleoid-associated protein n=1 Tax=Photobacterium leiognathi TaxID=553611 RepID=UPI002981339D|nr:nucleoid-associated protein [Photobacterium leiognathi]